MEIVVQMQMNFSFVNYHILHRLLKGYSQLLWKNIHWTSKTLLTNKCLASLKTDLHLGKQCKLQSDATEEKILSYQGLH